MRSEKTPSFKVNQKLNQWYDNGIGKGGNLIDFALLYYHQCTVEEFLQMLSGQLAIPQPRANLIELAENPKESPIHILRQGPIAAISLCHYLEKRSIPLEIARRICQEVRYKLYEKEYVAFGFRNDAGGMNYGTPISKPVIRPKT